MTTQRVNAAAFVFVLVLTLGSHAGAAAAEPFREGLVLATSQLGLESGSGETSLNFAHLRDLWIRVRLTGTTDPVQLDLRLFDPQGTLIYEASVLYASDPAAHPEPVFQARTLRDGIALDYALPVSGSVIARYLSEGTWTLVAEIGRQTFSTSIDVSVGY